MSQRHAFGKVITTKDQSIYSVVLCTKLKFTRHFTERTLHNLYEKHS